MCTFISLNSHNHTVKEVLLLFPYPRWRHWGIGMLSHLSEARVRPRLIYAKQWGPIFDNYQGRNCFCSLSNDAPWISPSSRVWLWLSETVLWQGDMEGWEKLQDKKMVKRREWEIECQWQSSGHCIFPLSFHCSPFWTYSGIYIWDIPVRFANCWRSQLQDVHLSSPITWFFPP